MKTILRLIIFLCLFNVLNSCAANKNDQNFNRNPPAAIRPDSFPNDSTLLDYIQKVSLNYMWDGA